MIIYWHYWKRILLFQDCSLSKEKHLNVIESREKLEEDIMKTLDDIADLHCQNILNIDCSNKGSLQKKENKKCGFFPHLPDPPLPPPKVWKHILGEKNFSSISP